MTTDTLPIVEVSKPKRVRRTKAQMEAANALRGRDGGSLNATRTDAPASVRFYAPRTPTLTIVVIPEQWTFVETPVGIRPMMQNGKRVIFESGSYETSDPEIIAHLERYARDPKNARFPIFSPSSTAEIKSSK